MNANPSPASCPRCGTQVPADAPAGLCPRCLLALNLETESPSEAASRAANSEARAPATPPLPLAEVARLFPQLEIVEFLGRGGMGMVYKARQPRLDRWVALKILNSDPDPLFAERFAREARALAKLSHPNIVAVHDFGEADGHFFLILEHMDGMNLRQLMQKGRISPMEALAIVPKICDALQYAHEEGVVHRDIKPENVLLNQQGKVKIADFGIAKLLRQEPGERTLTGDHQVIGTPHYMAPEQVEKPQSVDHRADIYSLGVVFYEMLTGELPLGRFAPPSGKVMVDVRLDEVVLRALEKDPVLRYQHAGDLKTQVETFTRQSGETSATSTVGGDSNACAPTGQKGANPPIAGQSNSKELLPSSTPSNESCPKNATTQQGYLSYALKPPPLDLPRQLERMRKVERNIALPVRIVLVAYLCFTFALRVDRDGAASTQDVVVAAGLQYLLVYTVLQAGIGALFLGPKQTRFRVLNWAAWASGFLDCQLLSWLVLITGGFDSLFFMAFIALILRHSCSFPPGYGQLILNILVCGGYAGAGLFERTISNFEPQPLNMEILAIEDNSMAVVRVSILIVLTSAAYTFQIIQEKQRQVARCNI